MAFLKRGIPVILAVLGGLAVLIGLLFALPISSLLLNWVGYLAAAALLMGVLNLFGIHLRRGVGGNLYSVILVLSMLAVFGLAVLDATGQTQQGVETIFRVIQVPLEAALASLVAFFLLFAGVRMLRDRRTPGTILFLVATIFFLLMQTAVPGATDSWLAPLLSWIEAVVVASGMRGLLLGIALGVIALAVRLLTGLERPYSS